MDEYTWVYLTASMIVGTFVFHVATRRFDPFAPIWLFLIGYMQMFVLQALFYHDWAITIRGVEVVKEANFRAAWALAWFLGCYALGPGKTLARCVPAAPTAWSTGPINVLCPVLIVWGLFCAGVIWRGGADNVPESAEASLILSFPSVMLVAGVLLIVTGRQPSSPRPYYTIAGVLTLGCYMLIWMFNGKRSHSLIAVLAGVCSYYLPRQKRPSFSVLVITACAGLLAVGISIGWRYHSYKNKSQTSVSNFVDFITTFDVSTILRSINVAKDEDASSDVLVSHETEEYGGYLLMLDVVPDKADYDYGESYLRIFSTFIPRILWRDKPYYGRDQWVAAWVAGSELKRDSTFTGPSIGILGSLQLNGGATATFLIMGLLGVTLRSGYEFYRRYQNSPFAQAWWTTIYFNSWFMTVGDDPLTWFYYNYGFTTLPTMLGLFVINKAQGDGRLATSMGRTNPGLSGDNGTWVTS